jgi:hypothetical protein
VTYFENVKAAGLALARGEDANWALARLTHESTITGGGPPTAGRVQMDVWCRDVRDVSGRKFSNWTGRTYKAIWERFGTRGAPSELPSWSEAYEALVPGKDQRFTAWSADNVLEKGTPQTKVETFRRLAEDPDVATNQEAQKAALPLGIQFYRQHEQDVRDYHRRDEIAERQEESLERTGRALDVEAAVAEFERAARRLEAELAELLTGPAPATARFVGLQSVLRSTRETLDRVEHWIEHGRSDVETFVASVLRREDQA